jgi:hypothetical protein
VPATARLKGCRLQITRRCAGGQQRLQETRAEERFWHSVEFLAHRHTHGCVCAAFSSSHRCVPCAAERRCGSVC